MPANSRVFLKPFIGGLNTEGSDVDDMVLNTSDELNCTILPEQMRGRRYGFNIEKDGKWIDSDVTENLTGSIYYWKNVAKTDLDIIVCRLGDKLYFFDAAIKPISDSDPLGEVSLADYIIDTNQFYKEKFGFAVGDGKLTVVNRWMQPVRIIYDINTSEFVIESFTLSIRDTEGVIDSWGVKSADKLISEGNDEPNKDTTDPVWTITDSSIAAVYLPLCDTQNNCYLIRKRRGLDKQYKIGPLTKTTVGTETHVFYNSKDIGIYQTGNYIYGGSREHYYNLLNQGWSYEDLIKFKQAMESDNLPLWPDNTMAVSVGRDNTGEYNTGDVLYTYLGNTHQSRGHFILDYFKMNRSEVSGIWDFSNAATAKYSYQNTWIRHRHLRGVSIYNHSTIVPDSQGIVTKVILLWTKLYRKSGKKSSDLHWRGNIGVKIYGLLNGKWTQIGLNEYRTYSDDGASATDPKAFEINIENLLTRYDQYRVDVRYYDGNASDSAGGVPYGVTMTAAIYVKEERDSTEEQNQTAGDYFSKGGDSSRVTDVAYMSGKYFYLCKDSVLFSQTVREDGTGFDLCYQNADPTSTEVSDVVTTDGGYVKFNTMGRGLALKTFNRGVLVFGRDVVYGLISPLESRFTATDYDILELSRAGLVSPSSVVSTTQQVYYWSPTGIYTIGVNPETGSTIFAQSISINTVQTFYNNLPQYSKENCKGVYDYTSNRIYWYYPTNEEHLNNLDGCLVYDLTYNCFMPQQITEDALYNSGFLEHTNLDVTEVSQSYEIEPTVYLRAGGNRVVAGEDKVLAVDETSTDYHRWTSVQHLIAKRVDNSYKFSIGDFNDREFRDWEYNDYSSYLVSRPITLGDTYFNKQTPVMQTLFKRTEEYKLKHLDTDITTTVYNIKGLYDYQISDNHRASASFIYNSGKVKKASVTIDFRNYDNTFVLHNVSAIIYGYDKNDTSVNIAYKYLSPDIVGGSIYTFDLDVVNEEEFDHLQLRSDESTANLVTPQILDKEIPVLFSVTVERTDISAPLFKGFKEVSYDGNLELSKITSSKYQEYIDTANGHLLNAKVKIAPSIKEMSPYFSNMDWTTSSSSFLAGTSYATGISGAPSRDYPSYEGQSTRREMLFNKFGIRIDGFNLTGTSGTLEGMFANYQFTLAVPEYEDFSYYTGQDYTTPSGAIIRMRWGWSVNPLSNRWDMMQNGYRPQKDFLHDDYVESRLHIHGRGKAFQVEIRNDENKDFRLTGLNIITRSPQ